MKVGPVSDSPSAAQEEALLRRAREGDLDAFDRLVELHQERVFNLCLWVLKDRDDAADAAQDAFIRAYRFLHKFRGDASFATWLGRIALNAARDSLARKKKAPRPLASFASDEEEPAEPASADPSPPELLVTRERQRAVRQALGALPEHHRVVLVLFEMQGRAYEEAASILQLPVGTVKSRLNRARAALRELLEKDRELFG